MEAAVPGIYKVEPVKEMGRLISVQGNIVVFFSPSCISRDKQNVPFQLKSVEHKDLKISDLQTMPG